MPSSWANWNSAHHISFSIALHTLLVSLFCRSTFRLAKRIATNAFFRSNGGMADSRKYDITVTTQNQYLEDQSSPDQGRFVFAYTITIANTGTETAQLVSRHWVIIDAEGKVQDVRGLGVVGQQPMLKPGEKFEYSSGCAIATPVGTMRGSYQMVAEDGTHFEAEVKEFTLAMPRVLH